MTRLKKGMFTGIGDVFTFTFCQTIKNRNNIIATVILTVIALFALPVYSVIQGDANKAEQTKVTTLYVAEEDSANGFAKGMEAVFAENAYLSNVKVVESDSMDEAVKQTKETENAVAVSISIEDGMCKFQYQYNGNSDLGSMSVGTFADTVEENYQKIVLLGFGVDQEAREKVEMPVVNETVYASDDTNISKNDAMEETDPGLVTFSGGEYAMTFAIVIILIFVLSFGGEAVASSIVTEKASKVIEYLLITVKPVAIVTGKVVATLAALMCQMGIILAGAIGSTFITGGMTGKSAFDTIPEGIVHAASGIQMNGIELAGRIIVLLLVLVLGLLLYGMFAGLAGASISKMDELAEGVKMYSVFLVVSAYAVMYAFIMGSAAGVSETYMTVISLLPITSIFAVPGFLITGKISLGIALLSAGILLISVWLMMRFVANVYEYLIYYNGSPLSLKQLFQLSKDLKKDRRKHAKKEAE